MLDSPPGMESSRLYVKIRRKRLEISPAERDLRVWADGVCLGVRTERENKGDRAKAQAACVFLQRWNSSYFHKQGASCISKGLSPGEQRL